MTRIGKRERSVLGGLAIGGWILATGCAESIPRSLDGWDTTLDSASSTEIASERCEPGVGFTVESTNPYFPMDVGRMWVLEGEDDGEAGRVEITVLDQTEVVAGVTTRVIEEREWVDGELYEVSRNFFAQAPDGTVCYFGEEVDDVEDGEVVGHHGAWRADDPGSRPGIIMPADPRPGMEFIMEIAPGEAEDRGRIVGTGSVRVPAGTFSETILVKEVDPRDGDTDYKVFAAGVGILVDEQLELVSR